MSREIKSGKHKVTVPCSENLKEDFYNACGQMFKKSAAQAVRDFMQETVSKFNKWQKSQKEEPDVETPGS